VRPILSVLFFTACLPFVYAQDHSISAAGTLSGDVSLSRFELGGQVANIRTGCSPTLGCINFPQFGLGLGGIVNVNQHFAIDGNWNVTPNVSSAESGVTGGRANELLVGARAELRAKHYGYFLEAKPGILNWNHVVKQQSSSPPYPFTFGGHTSFVSDVGGGVEYSPGARIHVRVEVGDLVVRYATASWSNMLQSSAGIYVGVGKPIDWKPPTYDAKTSHPFFNKLNIALITCSVLGTTADGITTHQFMEHGIAEADPYARPLVKYGWSGQVSLATLEVGGEILGMYGLHRIGQHWLERLLPVSLATTHGIFAYKNTKLNANTPGAVP
jgi:hypothetical protein